MRGVIDFQVADDVDQHFQLSGSLGNLLVQLLCLSDSFQRLDARVLLSDAIDVGRERVLFQQELDAILRQLFRLLFDLLFQRCDGIDVHVFEVAECNDFSA